MCACIKERKNSWLFLWCDKKKCVCVRNSEKSFAVSSWTRARCFCFCCLDHLSYLSFFLFACSFVVCACVWLENDKREKSASLLRLSNRLLFMCLVSLCFVRACCSFVRFIESLTDAADDDDQTHTQQTTPTTNEGGAKKKKKKQINFLFSSLTSTFSCARVIILRTSNSSSSWILS